MADWVTATSLYTPRGERKYLTADERIRFFAAATAHPRRDVALLCLTIAHLGCRISEALSLRASSIFDEQGFIAVISLKKRGRLHVREIPAPDKLLEDLSAFASTQLQARIWPWSRSQAWRLIKGVMATAQIAPGIHATPKGLRHAFGLHAIRSAVPLNMLQKWLGHASMKTTAIYADAMGHEEREIASRMWHHSCEEIPMHPNPADDEEARAKNNVAD